MNVLRLKSALLEIVIVYLAIPAIEPSGSAGKTFVQTFNVQVQYIENTVKHAFILATDSEDACNVTITADIQPWTTLEISVSKGRAVYYVVPVKSNVGLKLEAPCDFVVNGINLGIGSADGWLAYPAESLGSEYLILGPEPWSRPTQGMYPLQLSIVALNNETECVVTFTNGTNRTTYLSAAQADYYTDPSDLSGSRVLCNDKVTVLTGHQCTNVPAGCAACDHTVEQVPPMTTLGRSFILACAALPCVAMPKCCTDQRFCDACYDIYRVLALENDTLIVRNGTATNESLILHAGQTTYILQLQNETSGLISTKPLLVASFAAGGEYAADETQSDPEFSYVPKVDSYVSHYQGVTCLAGFDNFANLLVPAGTGEQVFLNGSPVLNQSEAIQVPGMEFDVFRYRFDCSGGTAIPFIIEHKDNKNFGMFVFGNGTRITYGYWAGMILDVDPYFCLSAQINFTQSNIEVQSCTLTRYQPAAFETPTIWTDAKCCNSNQTNLSSQDVEMEFVPKQKRVWYRVWTLVDGCGKKVTANQTITVWKSSKPKVMMQFMKGIGAVDPCDEDK